MSRPECNTLPISKEFIRGGKDAYYCVGGGMVVCLVNVVGRMPRSS